MAGRRLANIPAGVKAANFVSAPHAAPQYNPTQPNGQAVVARTWYHAVHPVTGVVLGGFGQVPGGWVVQPNGHNAPLAQVFSSSAKVCIWYAQQPGYNA